MTLDAGYIRPIGITLDVTEDGGELFYCPGEIHIHTDIVELGVVRRPAIDVDAIFLPF